MSITGKAVNLDRVWVVSPCGFNGKAGYKEEGITDADAQLSFMPKTAKVAAKVTTLEIDGRLAEVVKAKQSDYIDGMWTFLIKYQE
jgi:hypothetical protein